MIVTEEKRVCLACKKPFVASIATSGVPGSPELIAIPATHRQGFIMGEQNEVIAIYTCSDVCSLRLFQIAPTPTGPITSKA